LLALWSIDQLDADDVHAVRDALLAIAALPPPERRSFSLSALGGPAELESLELWELRSAWK